MSITSKAIFAVALFAVATSARSDGLGNYGILGQGEFGGIGGPLKAPAAIVCSPGASNGQLDFSVCSNIIYVPALIH